MDRKIKNTLILIGILVLIIVGGGIFSFLFQKGEISAKTAKMNELERNALDTDMLLEQLKTVKERTSELDSILTLRKFNIPVNLAQSRFYDFVNKVSFDFSPHSFVNIEYEGQETSGQFTTYLYTLSGSAEFNDFYKLVYAIEQSKELKKIKYTSLSNFIKVDDEGMPYYLVTYNLKIAIYFSDDDRFASATLRENRLHPNTLYDIFYPLIRNEIPPNKDNLLDVQTAHLLALIPDGAFMADASGRTYLLWEGDEVYLGYLTELDYNKNEVHFILNKGGIIERIDLSLEKEKEKQSSDKK